MLHPELNCVIVSCHSFPFNPIHIHFLEFKFPVVKVYYLHVLLVPKTEIGYVFCFSHKHIQILQILISFSFKLSGIKLCPHSLHIFYTDIIFKGILIALYNTPTQFETILNISCFCKIIISKATNNKVLELLSSIMSYFFLWLFF